MQGVQISYQKARGFHFYLCLLCGTLYSERIPDQADDRYCHNPGNPWLGVCGGCNRGSPSAGIRLGNSSLPPEPNLTEDSQPPAFEALWGEFWDIARRFERKARAQDREDLRHNIIIRLVEVARVREANGEALTEVGKLRTASLVVLEYWHRVNKTPSRVCILSGVAKKPDYAKCSFRDKPQRCSQCPYLAIRPIESLNQEIEQGQGDATELWETIPDDRAIDLEAWVDARTWLLGCPKRLVEIATKRAMGKPLDHPDRLYLSKWRKREQKRLF